MENIVEYNKHNVCLFIKDKEHLEEIIGFLKSKGENIHKFLKDLFTPKTHWDRFSNNNLMFIGKYGYWNWGYYNPLMSNKYRVTTEQFKKLWE